MKKLTLAECVAQKTYKILKINCPDKRLAQQLDNLGFMEEESVTFLKSNYGKKSFLVKVMGINIALDKHVCEMIDCYE